MITEVPTRLRLVRCSKCRKVLPELPNVPVYQCGGCGTILQARRRKNNVDDKDLLNHGTDRSQKTDLERSSSEDKEPHRSVQEEPSSAGELQLNQNNGSDQSEIIKQKNTNQPEETKEEGTQYGGARLSVGAASSIELDRQHERVESSPEAETHSAMNQTAMISSPRDNQISNEVVSSTEVDHQASEGTLRQMDGSSYYPGRRDDEDIDDYQKQPEDANFCGEVALSTEFNHQMSERSSIELLYQPTRLRLVRCSKCRKVLPELPNVPVYQCGGCGTILQARRRKNNVDDKDLLNHGTDRSQKTDLERSSSEDKEPHRSVQEEPSSAGELQLNQNNGSDQSEIIKQKNTNQPEETKEEGTQYGGARLSDGAASSIELDRQHERVESSPEAETHSAMNQTAMISSPRDNQISNEVVSSTEVDHQASEGTLRQMDGSSYYPGRRDDEDIDDYQKQPEDANFSGEVALSTEFNHQMSERSSIELLYQPTRLRLVRCSKCRKVLPELPNVPVYQCGGCGTILQARRRKNNVDDKDLLNHGTDRSQKTDLERSSSEDKEPHRSVQEEPSSAGELQLNQNNGSDQSEIIKQKNTNQPEETKEEGTQYGGARLSVGAASSIELDRQHERVESSPEAETHSAMNQTTMISSPRDNQISNEVVSSTEVDHQASEGTLRQMDGSSYYPGRRDDEDIDDYQKQPEDANFCGEVALSTEFNHQMSERSSIDAKSFDEEDESKEVYKNLKFSGENSLEEKVDGVANALEQCSVKVASSPEISRRQSELSSVESKSRSEKDEIKNRLGRNNGVDSGGWKIRESSGELSSSTEDLLSGSPGNSMAHRFSGESFLTDGFMSPRDEDMALDSYEGAGDKPKSRNGV